MTQRFALGAAEPSVSHQDGGSRMRLDQLQLSHLRRAIEIYLEIAYREGGAPAAVPVFTGDDRRALPEVLGQLLDETAKNKCEGQAYALRLGNSRYKFMKLRLAEHLVRGEFFFSVDTHDQMFADPNDRELARLKEFNREVAEQIEAAWEGATLPTVAHLKGLVSCMPMEREAPKGQRILLVDDDAAIQDTIALLLESKGYAVDRAWNGEEAIDLFDPDRHALVLMDVEMPRMCGDAVCRELKSNPRTARTPILLTSACAIDLAKAAAPDGYLLKPFHAETLFRFLDAHLSDARRGSVSASSASR